MKESRKKIRVCLLFVVLMAIVIGVTYYFYDVRDATQISQGTLITRVGNWTGSLWQ